MDEVWQRLDPDLWESTHNPWHILQTIAQTRLEELAADPDFLLLVEHHVNGRRKTLEAPSWFSKTYPASPRDPRSGAGETPRRLLNNDASPHECAARGRDKEAGSANSSAIRATDDEVSPRKVRSGGQGFAFQQPASPAPRLIAYFSMEFGLSEALPIYSGGLGILAGDFLKVASDLGVPVVGVGLLWQQGYFRQALNPAGEQIELFPYNDPGQLPIVPLRDSEGEWLTVALQFPRRLVRLRVWEVKAGRVRLYLLDSNDPVNNPADRGLTGELYGGGPEMRLQQEMILGIGGWQVLRQMGLEPEVCHLNEGHAAFAVLERARCFMEDHGVDFDLALTATRLGNLFTTHTPVEAGFDRFPAGLLAEYMGGYAARLGIDLSHFLALGRSDPGPGQEGGALSGQDEAFNMAYLAIRGSGAVNGVSRLHGEVSRSLFQRLFPRWPAREVPVGHVTNGVHVPSWDSPEADALWTTHCGKERWLDGVMELGDKIRAIGDEELWAFREKNRRKLIHAARDHVRRQGPVAGSLDSLGMDVSCLCDPAILTLGFARRFTSYKRVNLLLHDPDRLERILCGSGSKVQLVLAGKAHPADTAGKAMIHQWTEFIRRCDVRPHTVFLVDYDMGIAEHLVHGVDVWINTPRRPWEASGTSGMKVLVNGGLNLSELDGWWAEAYSPEVGWALGDRLEHDADPAWDAVEAERLYDLIENELVPEFYDRDDRGIPRRWVDRVRESMARLAPYFSANRMIEEYLDRYYLPATAAYRTRLPTEHELEPAGRIQEWRRRLDEGWREIEFVDFRVEDAPGPDGHARTLTVELELGSVPPDSVAVQLYAEPLETAPFAAAPPTDARASETVTPPEIHPFVDATGPAQTRTCDAPATRRTYVLSLATNRPLDDFTPRVVPSHPNVSVPLEAHHILWYR